MAEWNSWLDDYYARYQAAVFDTNIRESLERFHDAALKVKADGRKMMFAGNGASASIASHGAVDFTKQARVRSVDFNEPNLITAYANDFGFEKVFAKAVEHHGDAGDVLVLISVSGRSPNAVAAAKYARANGITVVSFTGANAENPLKSESDIAFWCDSKAYNIVECTHMIWLTTVVDMIMGSAEYSVS